MEIPDKYKGRVIGKWRANLYDLETRAGVKLIVRGGEVYIVRGTQQQRRHVKMNIGTIVVCTKFHFDSNSIERGLKLLSPCADSSMSLIVVSEFLNSDS